MLPSLQDIPGLLPGVFQRGDAASTEQTGRGHGHGLGRGLGRPSAVDHSDHSHRGHHGRDSLSLSPEAQAQALDDSETGGDAVAAETDSKSLLGQAGGMIRKALETIRNDLAKALEGFGFDNAAIENFTKAFVEPVLAALKDGVNFTAELTFAALSQVTTVSAGGTSQSTSLVAQSLSIEVNNDTGEVSVSLAKVSFEQQVETRNGGVAAPLLVIDPDDLDSPSDLARKILDGGAKPISAWDNGPAKAVAPVDDSDLEETGEAEETAAPAKDLQETLAEVRKRLSEDAVDLQTRLTIYSVSYHKNDKGESITKLLLDAQVTLTGLTDDASTQEEAQSLDVVA